MTEAASQRPHRTTRRTVGHDETIAPIAHSTSSVDDSKDCIGPVASPMPRTSKRKAGTPAAASARARSTN